MSRSTKLQKIFGNIVRQLRLRKNLSQDEFGFLCSLDRTYISDIEQGKRNISLANIVTICNKLDVKLSDVFYQVENYNNIQDSKYKIQKSFKIDVGFFVTSKNVFDAVLLTNKQLQRLPFVLFQDIDLKSLSGIVGAIFCSVLSENVDAIVNPIEKGHPDIVPKIAIHATEENLRNYEFGLEIKCTVGNISKGSNLIAGFERINKLTGITWQAHHREVVELMGLIIDFVGLAIDNKKYPVVSGVFYTNKLSENDWGEISGTTGRNTKVTGMLKSGKEKMGKGWIVLKDDEIFVKKYSRYLNFKI